MTVEEAKAKLVECGIDQAGWSVIPVGDDYLIQQGRVSFFVCRQKAEELSNALRSVLYGVNCPRCTWTHSDAVPECATIPDEIPLTHSHPPETFAPIPADARVTLPTRTSEPQEVS